MSTNKSKFTLAFLYDFLYVEYVNNIFISIVDYCNKKDQNLICFGVGSINSPDHYFKQKNYLLNLVSNKSVDGIISLTSSLANYMDTNEIIEDYFHFKDLPIVHIGSKINGAPCVLIDNSIGINQLMEHLIIDHNYKKIAFIKGPSHNYDANERFISYKNNLKKYNIKYNEDLVINGNFDFTSGETAIKILLDERKVHFDVIIGANDYMALSAIKELEKRHLKVPEQYAVAGYDNIKHGYISSPKLTTIKQPFSDIAKTSVELLLNILNNQEVPLVTILPSELVIRDSCGCSEFEKIKKILSYQNHNNTINSGMKSLNIEHAVDNIMNLLKDLTPGISKDINFFYWFKILYDEILNILDNQNDEKLLKNLNQFLNLLINNDIKIEKILTITSFFLDSVQNLFLTQDKIDIYFELYKKISILTGIISRNNPTTEKIISEDNTINIYRVNEVFIKSFKSDQLKKAIYTNLPILGIKYCYVCLYKNKNDLDHAKLFAYFDPDKKIKKLSNKIFPSKDLLPGGIDKTKSFQFTIAALYFKNEQLGYIILDTNPSHGLLYENLSTQISSALKGAFLSMELNNYTHQLEEKVAERTKELEEANKKLRDLDKLKNDFIANITHNFRSPLMVIMSITDLALKKITKNDKLNIENYQLIYEASLKLKRSIDKLLELAKIDAKGLKLSIKRINIVKYLNQVINFYQSALDKTNIVIEKILPENEISDFFIDIEKFEEIINNILSNAIKYIDPENGYIKVELKNKKNTILINISDNGIGISNKNINSIFNRFEQVLGGINTKFKGTGIGLAFAKQLVELMGGKIWAESKGIGKGSSFNIELKKGLNHLAVKNYSEEIEIDFNKKELSQILKSEIETILEKDEIIVNFVDLNSEDEFNFKKSKILIIDDDRYIRKIIADYLDSFGYKNYCITSSGKTGLDAIYTYRPDLIICDYNMEPIKGDQIHDEIRTNPAFKNVPFIFLSAVDNQQIILDRKEKGANAFLQKPVEEKNLKLTIDNLLKQYMEYLKMYKLAYTDELSSILNRRSIMEILNKTISSDNYFDLSIIFFDIDNFKNINDTYGHQAGDLIIKKIGDILKSNIKQHHYAGRYGGDEFLIIMPDTIIQEAIDFAEELRINISNSKVIYNYNQIFFKSSFGVSNLIKSEKYFSKLLGIDNLSLLFKKNYQEFNQKKIDEFKSIIASQLLKIADIALYKAKQSRCFRCGFSSEKIDEFNNNKCPKCKSENIIIGRNKVEFFY